MIAVNAVNVSNIQGLNAGKCHVLSTSHTAKSVPGYEY